MFARLEVEIDEQTLGELVKLYQRNFFELYSNSLDAVRKAKDLGLGHLFATTPLFIFERHLKQILHYIDFICTGYEAVCEKSDPKMYKKVLEHLKVRLQETVIIGDDIDLDILIPKSLRMRTIWLNRNGKLRNTSQSDAFASNLNDAMKVIITWMN